MSYNTGLSAVMDVTSADNVRADILLCPSFSLGLADTVTFCLGSVFEFPGEPFVVIVWLSVFSKGNAGAFGVGYFAVLNDPAFGPVRTDHTFLIGGGRGPLGGGFGNGKAGQGNVAYTFFIRIEAVPPHIDLYIFLIWICSLEIGVDHSLIFLFVLFCIPGVNRKIRIPGYTGSYRI